MAIIWLFLSDLKRHLAATGLHPTTHIFSSDVDISSDPFVNNIFDVRSLTTIQENYERPTAKPLGYMARHIPLVELLPVIERQKYYLCRYFLSYSTIKDRREMLMARFFKRQVHYLLPERRDNDTIRSLRNSQPFPLIRARTNKFYKSFLPYCLKNFT